MVFDDTAYKILHHKDYGRSLLWIPKLMLKSIFLWPNNINHFWSTFMFLIFSIFTGINLCGTFLYIYANKNDLDKVAYAVCVTVLPTLSIVKNPFTWYKLKDFEALLNQVNTKFWPYDLVEGKTENNIRTLYNYLVNTIMSFYVLNRIYTPLILFLPLFSKERTLPYPCSLPIAWNKSPTYEILYATQIIVLELPACMGVMGTDFFIFILCECVANQYRILQRCFLAFNNQEMIKINNKLRRINPELNGIYDDIRKEYFVRCVQHHAFILRFIKEYNKVLNPIETAQLLMSVLGICFVTFLLSRPNVPTLPYITTFLCLYGLLYQLAGHCLVSTDLNYQASLIPECIFKSNWAEIDSMEFKKDVAFVIQHCQKFPQITAYNLYEFNMTSYFGVIKLAFSLYTILKNMVI